MPHGLPTKQLTIDADAAIQATLGGCSSPPLGEVDCVAAIVVNGVPAIATAWGATLASAGCKLTMHGVFCHGSPMVDYPPATTSSRCELADLLVVMDYSAGALTERTANLIQAKMDKGGMVAISSGTATRQLHLYQNWPTFGFASRAYDPRQRDLNAAIVFPKAAQDAGRYGAIDLSIGGEEWRQLDPTAGAPFATSGARTLGDFLANLADAQPRCGALADHCIGPPPTTFDDWSFTVAELLDVTFALTHRALFRAGGTGHRGLSVPVIKMASWTTTILGGDGTPPDQGGRVQLPAGISIIHGIIERMP